MVNLLLPVEVISPWALRGRKWNAIAHMVRPGRLLASVIEQLPARTSAGTCPETFPTPYQSRCADGRSCQ